MAKLKLIFNLFIFAISVVIPVISYKCDEDEFYKPYAVIRRKKSGGQLAGLKSSGFLDLRFRNRVVLCVNGPVILYKDVERLDSGKEHNKGSATPEDADEHETQPEEELRFRNGELHVFSHKCISVNKVPPNILKKMKEDQGRNNPEIMPDTHVTGKLVLGVFLIAAKEGMNHPEMAWFKASNFDYIKSRDKTVKDSSFIVSGSNVTHCMRLPDGTNIRIGAAPNKDRTTAHEVCRWTVKEEDMPWYSKLFQKGFDGNGQKTGEATLDENDYEIYECPDGEPDNNIILTMGKTTPEPISHVNFTEFDAFSLFNPNVWTPHGYRKDTDDVSGGDERSEDKGLKTEGANMPCSLDPSNPACMDGEDGSYMERTTIKDMQNVYPLDANSVEIMAEDCVPLPTYDEGQCDGIGENGNRLLELVLELDPAFKCDEADGTHVDAGETAPAEAPAEEKNTQAAEEPGDRKKRDDPPAEGGGGDAGGGGGGGEGGGKGGGGGGGESDSNAKWKDPNHPKCKNLDEDDRLSWKMDILCLVSDIFQRLCMPFRADMPFTIARVFGWYVYKAHMFGENMGRVGPGPGTNETPPVSDQFDSYIDKTDTWIILEKELERCRDVAKKENGGKGLKFQWEVGDETGKWKIPAIDGRPTRRKRSNSRRRRRIEPVVGELPSYSKKSKKYMELKKRWEQDAERHVKEDDFELIEEIDANTGEKKLHRQKRSISPHARNKSYFVPGISKKYILPGKSLTPIESEGTLGYAREVIQEYRPKPDPNDPRADSSIYIDYPENVHHCWNPQEDSTTKQVVCAKTEEIFFYEDRAEMEFELNIAIDLWWKIWATVMGYCNKAYYSRKSESFPRLYNTKYEYFFHLVQKEWKWPEDNLDLKIILSEYLTEESHIFMDTCLESAYINSNSHSYRPPRPMTIPEEKNEISNYFEEVPSYIYYRYHPEPSGQMK